MRVRVLSFLALSLLGVWASGTTVPPPTKVPVPLTDVQEVRLKEGVALHDSSRYGDAVAVYEAILQESPDAAQALLESCLSRLAMKNYQGALADALRGAQFTSPWLGRFHAMAGESYGLMGRPEEAVPQFEAAVRVEPDNFTAHYALGITFASLERMADAREALKASVALAPDQPDPNYALGRVFTAGGYRVPAVLALFRFLILEPETDRSKEALRMVGQSLDALRGHPEAGEQAAGQGDASEGDFTAVAGAVTQAWTGVLDETAVNDWSRLVSTIGALFDRVGKGDPAWRNTFVGSFYGPYFAAVAANKFTPPFCARVFSVSENDSVVAYLHNQPEQVEALLAWSAQYRWPKPGTQTARPPASRAKAQGKASAKTSASGAPAKKAPGKPAVPAQK
jgi:tetratricopeptide (TPR) repeat protein